MPYRLQHKISRIPFLAPLRTAHGVWSQREGILVRLTDEKTGRVGFGEVAPLPWFGSESPEESRQFLDQISSIENGNMDAEIEVPARLPATAFAVSCARAMVETGFGLPDQNQNSPKKLIHSAILLSAGETALHQLPEAENGKNSKTIYKWKIGVLPVQQEFAIFDDILKILPRGSRLRLDANAGLQEQDTRDWLARLASNKEQVDYLEQPMRPGQETAMKLLAAEFGIPVALDESVAGVNSLKEVVLGQKWNGPLVIKPAIFGSLTQLKRSIEALDNPVVFSSVFESAIGYQAVLQIAAQWAPHEFHGLGTAACLNDSLLKKHSAINRLDPERFSLHDLEQLWNQSG